MQPNSCFVVGRRPWKGGGGVGQQEMLCGEGRAWLPVAAKHPLIFPHGCSSPGAPMQSAPMMPSPKSKVLEILGASLHVVNVTSFCVCVSLWVGGSVCVDA